MASHFAFKETRVNLDASTPGSTIQIRLPGALRSSKPTATRSQAVEVPVAQDDKEFRKRHLAAAASIYHRQGYKSPRSFLWRVLEDGKVLSITPVDISKQKKTSDHNLTLRLAFPSAIRTGCVALSDSNEHDILSVFALLDSNQLYTLTLRPDYFRKATNTESNVDDWCKIYTAPAFGIANKTPHRLAALSTDELLISQYNGELLRLLRRSGGDGSEWTASQHSEGSVSFRNMIRWGSAATSMKFENRSIEYSTATSIATPSSVIDGVNYAFTVSLDHKLRVWNFQTGRIAFAADILNDDSEHPSPEAPKQVIQPSYSQLVKVYGNPNEETALCVTYSPIGSGEFKFWNVRAAEAGTLSVTDKYPSNRLEAPMPTSDLWTLADFNVLEGPSTDIQIWVLWKNNTNYRVQSLTFESTWSVKKIRESWAKGWQVVASETLRDTRTHIPAVLPGDANDSTEKWLELILTPGRFTVATIETCLAIYEQGFKATIKEANRKSCSLPERLCSVIASTNSLGRKSDVQMDYDHYRTATDDQWRRLYRLLTELDKQRGEALSLVSDPEDGTPWVVLADGVAVVRTCSPLESIWHNQNVKSSTEYLDRDAEVISPLVTAAASLRDSLSEQMLHGVNTALLSELFEAPSQVSPVRLRALYDRCDFASHVGDEEFDQLKLALGGSFKDVTPEVYNALLELMRANEDTMQQQNLLPLTSFGSKLVVRGVQETAELHRNVCLEQLILLVLIEGEVNNTEDGIGFETATIFESLSVNLKRLEMIRWLASTQISTKLPQERSNSISENVFSPLKKSATNKETVTVLEGMIRHLLGHDTKRHEPMMLVLTEVIVQICDPESKYELPPSLTQCFLLKNGRPDLAIEFSRFTLENPFDIYIQGRAFLAINDTHTSSVLFKKAAYGIGVPYPHKDGDYRSGGYLNEIERNLFNAGLPQYYSHIVALYDQEKIYSYTIDFARLALQFIPINSADTDLIGLRTDMHSRLFTAACQSSRYDLAHSVLSLFTDSALQSSSLRALVTGMCENRHAAQLIALPFLGLQAKVDDILAQKCAAITDPSLDESYHKILYAWRIKHSDFRGAAAVCFERLQRSKNDLEAQYITLINALSCVNPKHAWVLSEEDVGKGKKGKRKVVTLSDVRKMYQAELDRSAAVEMGQFEFVGESMDVDGERDLLA